MAGAWEFRDRTLTDAISRSPAHGSGLVGDAESHSIALATLGTLIFEWDAIADQISRPTGLQSLYGYSLDEIEPTFLWLRGLIHPDDLVRDRDAFRAQIASRAPIVRGQYRVRHKDGHWITVKSAGAASYDEEGRLKRLVGSTIDTDEATYLEEAHARLANVVRYSNDAIFSINDKGFVSAWSEGAARMYGYEATEIIGQPMTVLVPDDERDDAVRSAAEVLSGESRVFQATRRRKDAVPVAVEISAAPIRARDGQVLGMSTIHRDIGDARRRALADARLAAVVGASHDAIVTLDADQIIETWNRGANELFGWTAKEAIGRSLFFLVPEDRRREHEQIEKQIATGESAVIETVRVTKAGLQVAVSLSISSFVDEGSSTGAAVTFRDIGDRLARDSHVHLLLKELSHRSKNLLAIVQGIARQSAMRTSDFSVFLDNFTARLRALAHAHDLLVQENWHGADMHALVAMQTGAFEIAADVMRVRGERLLIKPEAAQNIGLSLHELASNALRYGALSAPGGHVEIDWEVVTPADKRLLRVTWREFGGPAAQLPKRSGFGILVLSQITPRALGGEASLTVEPDGLVYALQAPVENVISQHG